MRQPLTGKMLPGLILLATLVLTPGRLGAQPATRPAGDGFFVGVGAGWGSFGRSDCPRCPGAGGLSGYLDLGAAVSGRVRLGLISTAWVKREDPSTTIAAGNACGAVTFFPLPRGRLYARLGLGLATYIIDGGVETGLGIAVTAR